MCIQLLLIYLFIYLVINKAHSGKTLMYKTLSTTLKVSKSMSILQCSDCSNHILFWVKRNNYIDWFLCRYDGALRSGLTWYVLQEIKLVGIDLECISATTTLDVTVFSVLPVMAISMLVAYLLYCLYSFISRVCSKQNVSHDVVSSLTCVSTFVGVGLR